jgi:hypothetical protein
MRFERVTRELKVASRLLSTLMDELKAIGISCHDQHRQGSTEVMVPAAHSDRSPVLLLMGGGKSTVLKQIMKE